MSSTSEMSRGSKRLVKLLQGLGGWEEEGLELRHGDKPTLFLTNLTKVPGHCGLQLLGGASVRMEGELCGKRLGSRQDWVLGLFAAS